MSMWCGTVHAVTHAECVADCLNTRQSAEGLAITISVLATIAGCAACASTGPGAAACCILIGGAASAAMTATLLQASLDYDYCVDGCPPE